MISSDQEKIRNHLNTGHSIKVEEDALSMKLSCNLCGFGTRNMGDLKKHLINEHKKEEHKWGLDVVNGTFTCDEFETDFQTGPCCKIILQASTWEMGNTLVKNAILSLAKRQY